MVSILRQNSTGARWLFLHMLHLLNGRFDVRISIRNQAFGKKNTHILFRAPQTSGVRRGCAPQTSGVRRVPRVDCSGTPIQRLSDLNAARVLVSCIEASGDNLVDCPDAEHVRIAVGVDRISKYDTHGARHAAGRERQIVSARTERGAPDANTLLEKQVAIATQTPRRWFFVGCHGDLAG